MEERQWDGESRRKGDYLLGELVQCVRDMRGDITDLKEEVMSNKERISEIHSRVEDKLRLVENVFSTLKFVGYALIAIVSFKFGDIAGLYDKFLGH